MAGRKKVAEEEPAVEEVKTEEVSVSQNKPNTWSKKIKVTPEQVAELQRENKLVGYYEEDGQGIALIR